MSRWKLKELREKIDAIECKLDSLISKTFAQGRLNGEIAETLSHREATNRPLCEPIASLTQMVQTLEGNFHTQQASVAAAAKELKSLQRMKPDVFLLEPLLPRTPGEDGNRHEEVLAGTKMCHPCSSDIPDPSGEHWTTLHSHMLQDGVKDAFWKLQKQMTSRASTSFWIF